MVYLQKKKKIVRQNHTSCKATWYLKKKNTSLFALMWKYLKYVCN